MLRTLKKITSHVYGDLYYQTYSGRCCVFWGPANALFAKRAVRAIAKIENKDLIAYRFHSLYGALDGDGYPSGGVEFKFVKLHIEKGEINKIEFLERKLEGGLGWNQIALEFSRLIPDRVPTEIKAASGIFSLRGEY